MENDSESGLLEKSEGSGCDGVVVRGDVSQYGNGAIQERCGERRWYAFF